MQAEGDFSRQDLLTLVRNSFEIAWLEEAERAGYLAAVDRYAARA